MSSTVTAIEIRSDPRQPTRFEKKTNTTGLYPHAAGQERPFSWRDRGEW